MRIQNLYMAILLLGISLMAEMYLGIPYSKFPAERKSVLDCRSSTRIAQFVTSCNLVVLRSS